MKPPEPTAPPLDRAAFPRRLGLFLLIFVAVYALLASSWKPVQSAYTSYFMGINNAAYRSLFDGVDVEFRRPTKRELADGGGKAGFDTFVELRCPKLTGTLVIGSKEYGYIPTIALVALVVATPLPWPRRGAALLIGGLVVQCFVVFRVGLKAVELLSDPALAHFTPSPFWQGLTRQLMAIFVNAPASMYVVPIFIWVAVCFRPRDLARILPRGSGSEPVS